MSSRKSERDVHNLDSFDRIGDLPDSIMGVILSFLPTKDAIGTAILSKRWKFVWMCVPNLEFVCPGFDSNKHIGYVDMKFIKFVNRILLMHDPGLLNKFRLVWNHFTVSSSQATSWINTAITRNVHELRLCPNGFGVFKMPVSDVHELSLCPNGIGVFEMPVSVFNCVSLRSLELDGDFSLSIPIVVCLPRLESLKIKSYYFQPQEALEKVISGCPILNYLHLSMSLNSACRDDDDSRCRISSTSLRRLELFFGCDYCLELETPSLEYFKVEGFITKILVFRSLGSMLEAEFRLWLHEFPRCGADKCNSVVEALGAFDCAKALTLSARVIHALSVATISLPTKFKRLKKLTAEAYYCYCNSLQEFIQSADNLEVLTVMQSRNVLDRRDRYDPPNWTTPIEVPRCLSKSLKEVVFHGYYGCKDDHGMILYMLKHGSALEAMQISCDIERSDKKLELIKEISEFPRKSPACEVILYGL